MGWWGYGADEGDKPMDAVSRFMEWLDKKAGKKKGTACTALNRQAEQGEGGSAGLPPEVN